MGKRSRLSFGESTVSVRGVFSIVLGVVSLITCLILIIISGTSHGRSGVAVGACGIVAVVTSVMGVVFSILGASERDSTKLPAYVGFVLNFVITIAWCCLFAIGI